MSPGWYRFFGWVYFIFCAPSAALHVVVSTAIFKTPTFNERISLRLMFSIFNIFLGLSIETFWEAMMFLQLALGANRLYIVSRRTIAQEDEFRHFDWLVVIGWLSSFVYTGLYWIGGRRLHYNVDFLGWPTEVNGTTQTVLTVYLYNGETVFMCIGFVLCIITVFVVGYKRQTRVTNLLGKSSMEFRMILHISIIYILAISNIILWNVFSEAPVEFQALFNLEWILICTLPPYLNILMNNEIRRSVLGLIIPVYDLMDRIVPKSVNRILPRPTMGTQSAVTNTTNVTKIVPSRQPIKVASQINSPKSSESDESPRPASANRTTAKKQVAFASPNSAPA